MILALLITAGVLVAILILYLATGGDSGPAVMVFELASIRILGILAGLMIVGAVTLHAIEILRI